MKPGPAALLRLGVRSHVVPERISLRLQPPDEPLRCLLVQVRFSAFSFWNFVAACETMGASTQPAV